VVKSVGGFGLDRLHGRCLGHRLQGGGGIASLGRNGSMGGGRGWCVVEVKVSLRGCFESYFEGVLVSFGGSWFVGVGYRLKP